MGAGFVVGKDPVHSFPEAIVGLDHSSYWCFVGVVRYDNREDVRAHIPVEGHRKRNQGEEEHGLLDGHRALRVGATEPRVGRVPCEVEVGPAGTSVACCPD